MHHYALIQTLTTLDLFDNEIHGIGAQCFAQTLQNNAVRRILTFYNWYSLLNLNVDIKRAQSWAK